jgi:hypothetical protein
MAAFKSQRNGKTPPAVIIKPTGTTGSRRGIVVALEAQNGPAGIWGISRVDYGSTESLDFSFTCDFRAFPLNLAAARICRPSKPGGRGYESLWARHFRAGSPNPPRVHSNF